MEGSYLIFPFAYGKRGFALEVRAEEQASVPVIAVVSGAAAVLLIAGISLKKRKAKKRLAKRHKG